MPYVIRDDTGKITRATIQAVHGAERMNYDHPDFVAFLKRSGQDPIAIDEALSELRRTDSDMSRAVEDVVMVLLRKNIIKLNELPKPVQEKMNYRVKLRMTIQGILNQASGAGDSTH